MDFKTLYANTSEAFKAYFLDTIINDDSSLQEKFAAFVEQEKAPPESLNQLGFIETVIDIKSIFQESFEMVDPGEPDWDSFSAPRGGYIEEWEVYQMASEQEFQEVFEDFISYAMDSIIVQQPDILLAQLVGMYEAARDANVPDEYDSFDDVNDYLLSEFTYYIKTLVEKLRLSAPTDNSIEAAFDLVFGYWRANYAQKLSEITYFEPVLIGLAGMAKNTGQLLEIVKAQNIEPKLLPELTMLLLKSSGSETDWLQSALQLYRDNEAVARDLLRYYHENDQAAFAKIAREVLPTDPRSWGQFLGPYVSPQLDKDLFVRVFVELTIYKRELDYYQKVKPYLDEAGYNSLLELLYHDKPFLAQIFAADGRYADIKTLVEKDASRSNFSRLITPLLSVYPDYSLNKIKTMVAKTLQNERGRHVYEDVAKWLLLTKRIPGFEHEAAMLIKNTFNYKPTLPALRDEMKKMGVVG